MTYSMSETLEMNKLAFENVICVEWVKSKLWDPLNMPSTKCVLVHVDFMSMMTNGLTRKKETFESF